ncbi:tetratricopeptide repeat-containing hybrid sensor histidine kinase/response regulator [Neotamlana sedimentorum]|uniref:tetratricopeptide repeat-containing hybrid sensor histidine kinase/response regulator n=1 Tax=Neotamlana sedimentorum TaxID=1435349 RepID=UPI00069947CA|nr:response regulator [Tamlana sedimentorum]
MKATLMYCFLFFSILTFGKEDREIIKNIDNINSTATQYLENKNIVKAFKEFVLAKKLSDSIHDYYGSALASYNIGNIYNVMENYTSAKVYYKFTLESLVNIDDNYLLASTYLNLARIYAKEINYPQANFCFSKALEYAKNYNILSEQESKKTEQVYFEARLNLCELHISKGDLEDALISLLKIKANLEAKKVNKYYLGYYNYVLGIYYSKKELFNSATENFRKAIPYFENNIQNLPLLSNAYMKLSMSLAKSGKSTEAYLALLEHNKYKEVLDNKNKNHQDLLTKSKFLIEDYKTNADKANAEKLQQIQVANNFKKINIAIIITLVLLLISIVIIYSNYVSKRKLSNTLEAKNSELKIAKDKAIKTAELKSKFISNVSHELRTPLYGVVGITSLLLEKNDLNDADKKYLNSLKYSGDYLLNLINDILQVSKMEAQKVEIKNVSVNLIEMLNNLVNTFNYRLEETNNQLALNIDKSIPEYIKCDKVRLSQILINLIGNSIKFTTNGEIKLNVVLLSKNNDKVGLRFEVVDNGIGIPKEKFNTIFENFSQIEESNLNYQGTGLGLSITKNLVNLFGGDIKLESEVNVGTNISFELNFDLDNLKVIQKPEAKLIKDNVVNSENGIKILVAEDNKINQVVTKSLLTKQGYFCNIVDNGQKALEEIRNNHYDLVLMDINMPIMNGNEATKAIRRFNSNIPIIALTAADIEDISKNCKEIGFNDYIIKPFDNYEFFQVISENLQKSTVTNIKPVETQNIPNLRVVKAS